MAAAAFILLLLLMQQSSGGPVPPEPDRSSGGPAPGGGTTAGDLLGAGKALLPVLVGLAGGGTAAGGGTVAAGGGTLAAGGGTGTVVPGVVAGTAAAFPIGAVTVGLLANPFAWAIYILIASKVVAAQENDKKWDSELLSFDPNARDLHSFEQMLTKKVLEQRGMSQAAGLVPASYGYWRELQQKDERLDRATNGLKTNLDGWRTTYKFTWRPGDETTFRKVRALALEYLRIRAGHGYRMLKYWTAVKPESDWGLTDNKLRWMYEHAVDGSPSQAPGNMPGLGGLLQIPLAADGLTQQPRLDNNSYPEDPAQLRPPPFEADPINDLSSENLQLARFMALADAIFVVRNDPRPGMDLDAAHYADDIYAALALPNYGAPDANGVSSIVNRTPLEGLTSRDGLLITDPNVFGIAAAFNPQAIRQRTNAAGHEQLKVIK